MAQKKSCPISKKLGIDTTSTIKKLSNYFPMSKLLKEVSKISEQLRAQDNLTVHQILTMDMYEYNKELNQRAWDLVRAS